MIKLVFVEIAGTVAAEAGRTIETSKRNTDWKRIATEIKEAAGWKCQKCGKQCRRPGEPFDTHKRTLTVAHLNHTPEDIRPENLQAMCAPCHLRYDAQHHAETRKSKREQAAKMEG